MSKREAVEVQFTITYDGPEVQAGRMDARDLAPAMLSMAKLVEHSAALAFGPSAGVKIEVSADFRRGSFSYEVYAKALEVGSQILNSVDVNTVLALIGVGGTGGVIGLVKWLHSRKIKSLAPSNQDKTTVTTVDGDSTVVQAQVVNLYNNSTIRVDLQGVVEPLLKDGITEFRTGRGSVAETVIRQEEAGYFEAPPPVGRELQNKVSEEVVQIVTLSFRPGVKWQFALADGTPFRSAINDPAFLQLVSRHAVSFGAGDALLVKLRTVVRQDETGKLSAEREVEQVVRHIPPATQMAFDMLVDPHPLPVAKQSPKLLPKKGKTHKRRKR